MGLRAQHIERHNVDVRVHIALGTSASPSHPTKHPSQSFTPAIYHWIDMAEIHDIHGSHPVADHTAVEMSPDALVIPLRPVVEETRLDLSSPASKAQFAVQSPSLEARSQCQPESAADSLVRTIVSEHSESMFRLAKSIVRDNSLAEDVVQESVLKAWQAAASFRGDSSLRSWALRITHNTAISTLRKRREDYREPALVPEVHDALGQTDRQVHGRLMVNDLWTAIGALDPVSRSITVLREVEGLSYEEISELLELPLPTVKTRLFRARKTLATVLDGWR